MDSRDLMVNVTFKGRRFVDDKWMDFEEERLLHHRPLMADRVRFLDRDYAIKTITWDLEAHPRYEEHLTVILSPD